MNILIAAATSNSGKTTITMGLLRALRNRGLTVQPYKCGPDYIDTIFHEMASGRESVNLDTFMQSRDHVRHLFHHYGDDADCRVVEGVMGLYDGYDRWHGSSAEIASLLDLPVLLVINAKSAAYSMVPLIYGFKNYRVPGLDMRYDRPLYVIFNQVASENHYAYLKAACEDTGVVCLGYMPRNEDLVIPGRHLGLTIKARQEAERLIDLAAHELEAHVDLSPLFEGSQGQVALTQPWVKGPCPCDPPIIPLKGDRGGPSIAIAHDEAFNFTYRANIDAMRSKANVVMFSPLHDSKMPECDMLYLPGGYPELFAEQLSKNETMRQSIRLFAENDGKIFAECGGFMYLCNDIDGTPMVGVLPFSATMDGARLHLGYRRGKMKGHEFHYSSVTVPDPLPAGITAEQCQQTAKGKPVSTAIYHYKNVVAGYTHWYWAEEDKGGLSHILKGGER